MGNDNSGPLPPADPNMPIFALCFRERDQIRLVMAPPEVCDIVRRSCLAVDPNKLKKAKLSKHGWFYFTFGGEPFYTQSFNASDAIFARMLAMMILRDLRSNGWKLVLSSKVTRHFHYSTWFFQGTAAELGPTHLVCVSISSNDKLQLIGASDELHDDIVDVCQTSYQPGVQKEKSPALDVQDIKLKGTPFQAAGFAETIAGRRLVLGLIRRMHQRNFRLYALADLQDAADNMFFYHDPASQLVDARFFLITLASFNLLRLIDCPEQVADVVIAMVRHQWTKGVREVKELKISGGRAWEITLAGTPFDSEEKEGVDIRHLLCQVFQLLLSIGWNVLTALDASMKARDKSIYVFHSCEPQTAVFPCLAPFQMDKLRIIHADQKIIDIIRKTCASAYRLGIKDESDYHGSHQIVFNGQPFDGMPVERNDIMFSAVMFCYLLDEIHKANYVVACSGDLTASLGETNYAMHVWFLKCVTSQGNGDIAGK